MNPCKVCGKPDDEKPMCFRKERYCCELHRKVLVGLINLTDMPDVRVPEDLKAIA